MTIPEDHLKPPPGAPDGETLRLRELHAIAELLDILAREIEADVPPLAFLTDVAEQRLLFYRMMEIASEGEINQLCETHSGLYRFVTALEQVAEGIRSGVINVPPL